jgi:hypothetical protein
MIVRNVDEIPKMSKNTLLIRVRYGQNEVISYYTYFLLFRLLSGSPNISFSASCIW